MKKYLFLALLMATASLQAQITTDNPTVDRGSRSATITRIALDDEYTYVLIEYITPRRCDDCWVSLSSNTRLSALADGTSKRVISWGVYNDGEPKELELDERYSTTADRRYVLFMVFPRLEPGITTINIVEHTSAGTGWAWNGVHFNNPKGIARRSKGYRSSRSGSMPDRPGSGSAPEEGTSRQGQFTVEATGTCFALTPQGHLATCYHVVSDATAIRIRGIGGDFSRTYSARVIINDKNNDLAIIKISDPDFTTLGQLPYSIASSLSDVGEEVFTLGYPLNAVMGDEIKLTNGIISSRTGFQGDASSYQLSVAVYPGNSGGPLFNASGDVVGVVNARLLESATYAVKTPYLQTLAQSADGIALPTSGSLADLTLPQKVKQLRNFIYIIEIDW